MSTPEITETEHADGVSFTWTTLIGWNLDEFRHEIKWLYDGHVVTRFKMPPGGWSTYRDVGGWTGLSTREQAREAVEKFAAENP